MKEFIKRHVVVSYLLITFISTWVVYAPLIISYGDKISPSSPGVIPVSMLIGIFPSIIAFILIYIKEGKIKNSSLIQALKKKSSTKLYLLILLIMPAYMILHALLSNTFVTPYEFNNELGAIVLALTWGIVAALGEEFGWRGILLPEFLKKHTWLQSGFIVGVFWGLWHIPMNYVGAASRESYVGLFILFPIIELILDSVIIAGIYAISNGNLKATLLFHYTTTGIALFEGEIWKPAGALLSHADELSIEFIGLAIRIVFIVLIYYFIRKRSKRGEIKV